MKTFLILISLFVGSCEPAWAAGRRAPVPEPAPTPSPSFSTLVCKPGTCAEVTINPGVFFNPVEYYTTPAERLAVIGAGTLAQAMVQSACSSRFMLGRKLIQTNGQTNPQVVERLKALSGTVNVEYYYSRWTSAEAYTDSSIHLNRKFFTPTTDVEILAATLMHEGYGHFFGGYSHDYKWNPARSFSVPYSMGGADESQGGDVFDTCFVGGRIID